MALELQVHVRPAGSVRQSVCSIAAKREWTVQEAKAAVEAEAGVPAEEQRLLLGSRGAGELRGAGTLGDSLPEAGLAKLRLVRRPQEQVRWLSKVAERGSSLCAASPSVRKDRDVALAAVAQSGRALQFLPGSLRGDREVVLAAVEQDGYALRYAARELRKDRGVVLAAVRQNGLALHFATGELRGDRGVVLAAAGQDGRSLQFAGKGLRFDEEAQQVAETSTSEIFSLTARTPRRPVGEKISRSPQRPGPPCEARAPRAEAWLPGRAEAMPAS